MTDRSEPDLMAALEESLRDRSRRDRWCRVCKTLTNHTTEEDSRYDPKNPAHQVPGCLASDEKRLYSEESGDGTV